MATQRFSTVVTEYPQFQLLAEKLDNNGGWKELANRLGLSNGIQQDNNSSPTIKLLQKWKLGRNATMEVLINTLNDMDNTYRTQETVQMLQSWLSNITPNNNNNLSNSQISNPEVSQITQRFTSMTVNDNNNDDLRKQHISNALGSGSTRPRSDPANITLFVAYHADAADSWALLRSIAPSFKKIISHSCPTGDVVDYEFTANTDALIKKADLILPIITKGCLTIPSFLHVLEKALTLQTRIVVVHHVKSCKFPGSAEQPDSVKALFKSIATPLVDAFAGECWKRVLEMAAQDPSIKEDIRTDVFLSHKQDTAQAIATTFYEALIGKGFRVFLDVQTNFVLHDLEALVSQTSLFVFILTPGIFDSYWCRCEFDAAVKSNRKIFVVKPTDFEMPKLDTLSEEWKKHQQYFLPARLKDYDARYLHQFVEKLVKNVIKAQQTTKAN